MTFVAILTIAVIFLAVALFGFAMIRSGGYDVLSFMFLGLLGGFALAIFLGAAIIS